MTLAAQFCLLKTSWKSGPVRISQASKPGPPHGSNDPPVSQSENHKYRCQTKLDATLEFWHVPRFAGIDPLVVLVVVCSDGVPDARVRAIKALRVRIQAIDVDSAGAVDEVGTLTRVIVGPAKRYQTVSSIQHRAHNGTTIPPEMYASSNCAKYSALSIGF